MKIFNIKKMNDFDKAMRSLKKSGIKIARGLTLAEIDKAEAFYKIKFHPDHQSLIQAGLFTDIKGYNWRDFSEENIAKIREMLDWPLEGILFDIEHNGYWHDEAGQKPAGLEPAKTMSIDLFKQDVPQTAGLALAKRMFTDWYKQNVPQLIPIYSHQYMCSEPDEAGAPVYSVHQTDIIYYGYNIFNYLKRVFHTDTEIQYPEWEKDSTRFWSEIVS